MKHTLSAVFTTALLLAIPTAAICENRPEYPLDPRLGAFLTHVIKDPETLRAEKATYAKLKVSFEDLVLAVYTRSVRLDDTPDNSQVLAQLGEYIEKQRPRVSRGLLTQLEKFFSTEENRTFMRGMFLETVRAVAEQ